MYKKRITTIIIMILTMLFLFSGCSRISNIIGNIRGIQLTNLLNEEGAKIEEMSNEIIRCFTDRDKEALKNLFSEQAQNQPEFDDEIDKAFEFFLCDIYTTSEFDTIAGGSTGTRDGRRTEWTVLPDIPYISVLVRTEGDDRDYERRYYSISYSWKIIQEDDTTQEGIQYMRIELLNVDSVEIGE